MIDAEARSKVDILDMKVDGNERHRQELGRRLYEAEGKITELEGKVRDLERDTPGRKEIYGALLAVIAIVSAIAVAVAVVT